ncbi:MAG: peptidase [Nitrospinae bacterium]|jgi:proteic killer suppression protein|nr:peptidase [Nitrospinota bacterium]|tara:strand:+ start:1803 stop:2081 length:279 start_codon:yes stop_codon:yes gene_type:complete
MIQGFKHRGLRRLFERDDRSRVSAQDVDKIRRILAALNRAGKPEDMDFPGFRLHPLKGGMKGHWATTVTVNWRITFRMEQGDAYDVDLTDYH